MLVSVIVEVVAPVIIEFQSVSRSFKNEFFKGKVEAVKPVSFSVHEGEVYGLIGPNGSGKSTLMKMVLGLVKPSSGKVFVAGQSSDKAEFRDKFGYLPENPYFAGYLSGKETLHYYAKLSSVALSKKGLSERIEELSGLVGIADAVDRSVGTYSKGMLQRLGLAQAMIHDPEILILDEPTAGVDPQGAYEIREIIFDLKQRGKTILMCSHLLEQVQEVCDRVGMMHKGELVNEGGLDQLLAKTDEVEIVFKNLPQQAQDGLRGYLTESAPGSEIVSAGQRKRSLEELFIKLTQK